MSWTASRWTRGRRPVAGRCWHPGRTVWTADDTSSTSILERPRSRSPSSGTRSTGSCGGSPGGWLPEATKRSRSSASCTRSPRTHGGPSWASRIGRAGGGRGGVELGLEYRLAVDGLAVVARATNGSGEAAPFGIGFHPYLTMGIPVDDVRLTIPASRRVTTDERALPVGDVDVAGTEFDFTLGRPVGATRLDTCFAGLAR